MLKPMMFRQFRQGCQLGVSGKMISIAKLVLAFIGAAIWLWYCYQTMPKRLVFRLGRTLTACLYALVIARFFLSSFYQMEAVA